MIKPFIGKDIEEVYEENEHTEIADRMLREMKIGNLKGKSGESSNHEDSDTSATSSKTGPAPDEVFEFDMNRGSLY